LASKKNARACASGVTFTGIGTATLKLTTTSNFTLPAISAPFAPLQQQMVMIDGLHIVTANRSGWVRTSPHFYISPEEIDRMIAELPTG